MSNKNSMNMNEGEPGERKYKMTYNPHTKLVIAVNAGNVIVAKMQATKEILRLFNGGNQIWVKADIVDGVFTAQKIIRK